MSAMIEANAQVQGGGNSNSGSGDGAGGGGDGSTDAGRMDGGRSGDAVPQGGGGKGDSAGSFGGNDAPDFDAGAISSGSDDSWFEKSWDALAAENGQGRDNAESLGNDGSAF